MMPGGAGAPAVGAGRADRGADALGGERLAAGLEQPVARGRRRGSSARRPPSPPRPRAARGGSRRARGRSSRGGGRATASPSTSSATPASRSRSAIATGRSAGTVAASHAPARERADGELAARPPRAASRPRAGRGSPSSSHEQQLRVRQRRARSARPRARWSARARAVALHEQERVHDLERDLVPERRVPDGVAVEEERRHRGLRAPSEGLARLRIRARRAGPGTARGRRRSARAARGCAARAGRGRRRARRRADRRRGGRDDLALDAAVAGLGRGRRGRGARRVGEQRLGRLVGDRRCSGGRAAAAGGVRAGPAGAAGVELLDLGRAHVQQRDSASAGRAARRPRRTGPPSVLG